MLVVVRHESSLLTKEHLELLEPYIQPRHKEVQISGEWILQQIHFVDKDVDTVRKDKPIIDNKFIFERNIRITNIETKFANALVSKFNKSFNKFIKRIARANLGAKELD